MRKLRDTYTCALCGAVLEIPEGAKPRTLILGRSGAPSIRIFYIGGEEIHRCETPKPVL
jgi:hypothetical protein